MNKFLLTIVLISLFQSSSSFGVEVYGNSETILERQKERSPNKEASLSLDFWMFFYSEQRDCIQAATGFFNENNSYLSDSMSLDSSTSSIEISSPRYEEPPEEEPIYPLDFWELETLSEFKMPDDLKHLGIIPDGNRRWAEKRGHDKKFGHTYCFDLTLPRITKDAFRLGVNTLSIWLFSTDNWKRDADEVANLMEQIGIFVERMTYLAHNLKIRIVHLGREDVIKDRIPSLFNLLKECERITSIYSKFTLNLAIDYGGQDEIVRAIQKLSESKFDLKQITAERFTQFLDTGSQEHPGPDLVIRTSPEECKTSGFFSWHSDRYKIHNANCFAPDLTKQHLIDAVSDFSKRKRLFGR